MEITKLELTKEQADELFPTDLSAFALMDDSLVLGAMENGVPKALALLVDDLSGQRTLALNYISFGENEKEAGELIAYIENMLRANGVKRLSAHFMGDEKLLLPVHRLMKKTGFTPLIMNGHYLMYFIQDIEELLSGKTDNIREYYRPGIRDMYSVDDKIFSDFKEKLEREGESSFLPSFAKEYTRFYESGGEIKGYISFVNIDNRILAYYNSYFRGESSLKAILAMSVELVLSAAGKMEEGAAFVMPVSREDIYKGLKNYLGEAERDCIINEYIKIL